MTDTSAPQFRARLACGCTLSFRAGVEGSPVAVFVDAKSSACTNPSHVSGLALYDHREALRPSTRFAPPVHPDYEES